jgi:hypothetical protein
VDGAVRDRVALAYTSTLFSLKGKRANAIDDEGSGSEYSLLVSEESSRGASTNESKEFSAESAASDDEMASGARACEKNGDDIAFPLLLCPRSRSSKTLKLLSKPLLSSASAEPRVVVVKSGHPRDAKCVIKLVSEALSFLKLFSLAIPAASWILA